MPQIQETVTTNRKYKDRLFRLRFGSEEYSILFSIMVKMIVNRLKR